MNGVLIIVQFRVLFVLLDIMFFLMFNCMYLSALLYVLLPSGVINHVCIYVCMCVCMYVLITRSSFAWVIMSNLFDLGEIALDVLTALADAPSREGCPTKRRRVFRLSRCRLSRPVSHSQPRSL